MPERHPSFLGLYRTGLTSAAHRRAITVGREPILQDTMEMLRANAGRATKHHLLFIGLRGMGKTHLLSLIEDELAADPELAAKYLVARFPEESHRLLSFADFLLGLCETLASAAPAEPLWQELHRKLMTEESSLTIVDILVQAIRRQNQEKGRTLVVMLENLGEVFSRQIKDRREVAALRKFFMDSKNGCLLIATATMQFSGITSVDEPFYDFFDVQHLDQLTEEESIALVRQSLEWEKGKHKDLLAGFEVMRPRLLALYRMTGGNPRLTVMLSELVAHDSVTQVRDQFRILLDRVTPFFQDRLGSLPPQERALLETMATMRSQDKTPATIAARMRMKVTHVSSLLKRLSAARLLRSSPHPDDKRTNRYVISEGFFDLWLYMNLSRGARTRLPFLLDFFALFYPSLLEREKKRGELLGCLGTEKQADALAALDTLSEIGSSAEKARAKLQLASAYRKVQQADETGLLVQEAAALPLDRVGSWIVQRAQTEPATDYLTEIQELITLWDEHRTGNLESFAQRMLELGEGLNYGSYSRAKLAFLTDHLSEIPVGPDRIRLRLKIARLHDELAHWADAESQLRAALAEAETLPEDDPWLGVTLNNLAHLLQATNRIAEAEPLMRRALDIDEKIYGPDHPSVAILLNNLARLLHDTNRITEAEPLMRRALAIAEKSYGPDHPSVAVCLNNLARLLKDTDRSAEAEPLMRRALVIDEKSYGPDHPSVTRDLNNLARLLHDTNRITEAEPLMRRALAMAEKSYGPDHPSVAVCLNNLARLLKDTDRSAEAEPLMRRALVIDEKSYGPDHPSVAVCLNNLAQLLQATNRIAEAEPLTCRALAILLRFTRATGHQHPGFRIVLRNCSARWKQLSASDEEIRVRLQTMIEEADIPAENAPALLALLDSASG
jgi:tetratricopeptide (TPR) repeat protein/MoxR-like ATPase